MTHIPSAQDLMEQARAAAGRVGVDLDAVKGDTSTTSPINGEELFSIAWADAAAVDTAVDQAQDAFLQWRKVPAPLRGNLVNRLGQLLREHKNDIGDLISLEVGKVTSEARGEVQEMIDICDFAVGLSRQLYGRTMPSERPGHRLMETWHPLGVVGVISAFNFPAAVWSWNTAIALVCGDPVIWKPSEAAPLTALACGRLLDQAIAESEAPRHLSQIIIGGPEVGLLAPFGAADLDDDVLAVVEVLGDQELLQLGLELGPVPLLVVELGLEVLAHVGIGLGREHLVGFGEVHLGAAVLPVRIDDGPQLRDAPAGFRGRALVTGGVQLGELRLELLQLGFEVDQALKHEVKATRCPSRAPFVGVRPLKAFRSRSRPGRHGTIRGFGALLGPAHRRVGSRPLGVVS